MIVLGEGSLREHPVFSNLVPNAETSENQNNISVRRGGEGEVNRNAICWRKCEAAGIVAGPFEL